MKTQLASTTAVAALLALSGSAHAKTIVADLYGSYDAECGINITDCSFGTGLPVTTWYTNGSYSPTWGSYDTPSLFIVNTGSKSLTGLTLAATGYQGVNNGGTQSITIPNVAGGSVLDIVWQDGYAYQAPGTFFNYDYDDSYFSTNFTTPYCAPEGYSYCALIGNFDLSLKGTLNGGPISSDFSPDNTQDGGNVAGTFVGFEGVNPQGWTESIYDNHSGTTPGVLAYIYTGTHGCQTCTIPESSTWAMMLTGFAGLGSLALARRRRKTTAAAMV